MVKLENKFNKEQVDEKFKIFDEMLNMVVEGINLQQVYDSSPREYNGEVYYQAECHTVQMIGKKNNRITSSEIASNMYKTQSSVSQIVSKLKKKKLITQKRNAENNREYFLGLTKKGWELYYFHEQYDFEQHFATYQAYFTDISIEEMRTFMKIQKKLNDDWYSGIVLGDNSLK